jgi:hypothetical protein
LQWRIANHIERKIRDSAPFIKCFSICKYGDPPKEVQQIKSFDDLRNKFKEEIFDSRRRTIDGKKAQKIIESFACKKFIFNIIKKSIFNIFYEFEEYKRELLINESPEFWELKIPYIYSHFRSFDYVVCKSIFNLDKKLTESGKDPLLNFHRPSPSQIQKLRAAYWGTATVSEGFDYPSYVQLAVHLGIGPRPYEGDSDKNHIAFKLAFFRSIKADNLRSIQRKIVNNKNQFYKLLEELKSNDEKFVFYQTMEDRTKMNIENEFHQKSKDIAEDILRYDLDQNGIPLPRSTEFVKFIDWDEVRDEFLDEKQAVHFVTQELNKLLPLFLFFNDIN